jgi:hypothetical protein
MPSIERHWRWAYACSALLALGVTLWLASRLGPFDGVSVIQWSRLLAFDTAVQALVWYGAARSLYRYARTAHQHEWTRARAIAGDTSAIPVAGIPRAQDAADGQPGLLLVIPWRLSQRGCLATLWRAVVIALAFVLMLGAAIGIAVLLLLEVFRTDQVLVILGVMLALVLAGLGLFALFIRLLSRPSGSRIAWSLIASEEGITQHRDGKPDVFIRWSDARLLEVWSSALSRRERQHWRGYTLYSRTARIEWQEYAEPYTWAIPDGISRDELAQRQRALLTLIQARSGLTPRSFNPDLQQASEPSPAVAPLTTATRRFSVAGVSALLAIAAVLVVIGSATLLLPLTSIVALDFCVALVFGLSGGGVLVFTLLMMVRPARTDLPVDYHLPPVPPITLERDAVTLAWRWPLSARAQGLAIAVVGGLVCAAGVIGVISAVGNGFGDSTSILSGSTLHYLIGCVVALLGLLVFALAWSDVVKRSWYVEVTHEGLSRRVGKRGETLAWAEIETVIAHMSSGRVTGFQARHAGTDTAIEWPPIARAPARARGIAISGEELAALVLARSGRTLTVKTDE